jgi:hypothetical protein
VQTGDDRTVGGEHRVQRFNAQSDAVLHRVRQDGSDPFFDHHPRRADVAIGRRTAHQHQNIGVQRRSFFDGAPVVVDAGGAFSACGSGEPTAAAETGAVQSGIAQQACGGNGSHFGETIAPDANRRNSGADAPIDCFTERPVFCSCLIQTQA